MIVLNDNISKQILSDITVFSKYGKYIPSLKRRETWAEIVARNLDMHVKKFSYLGNDFVDEIVNAYSYVLNFDIFPSMRALQFGGTPIELNPTRGYNCSYAAVDSIYAFNEAMFLLLSGCGYGYSVQKHHVEKLPTLRGVNTNRTKRYLIGDSIEGWSDAIKLLVESYFLGKSQIDFDYRDIREKGAPLITSGGKAPGPQPLKDCIHNIKKVLDNAISERGTDCQLKSIEAHDIICYIADAVLSGGIRRAACISLFSFDDNEMLSAKAGSWWETNPQRGRANNSVVLVRRKLSKTNFDYIWNHVKASGCGEPGIFLTNDKEMGANPCCEISLKSNSFCNLTSMNVSNVKSQEELNNISRAAALIGTLQAGYTNFHYLRDVWKRNTEKDALLGVSMTGIASGNVQELNVEEAARIVVEENKRIAALIGINPAARATTIKPEGTLSLVAGTSSGVHAWHNPFYIRRMRLGKNEAIYQYLKNVVPDLLEDEFFKPDTQAVLSIPVKAPNGAIIRTESELDLLNRVKWFHDNWIKPGHIKGSNTHNVSVTVSIREDKWDDVGEWMWNNKESYNGISVLPYDNGTYIQAPFEDCTEEKYNELLSHCNNIDLTQVIEENNNVQFNEIAACQGGACEVKTI